MGKGGGSQTAQQKSDPWEGQIPYLTGEFDENWNTLVPGIFPEAHYLYKRGELAPDYYPGQTVAGMSDATSQALEGQIQRAAQGNSAMTAGRGQLESTLGGDYLNDSPFMNTDGNPQLEAMVQLAIGRTNAGVASNFANAGRYGSGAMLAAANDAAGNIATRMYGQAYDNDMNRALQAWTSERENQMRSAALAPEYAENDFRDFAALSEAGTALENYDQERINADMDRWNYDQNQAALALRNYANLIQGNYGSQASTTTNAGRTNPLGGMLTGAIGGAGLANLFNASNPVLGASALGGGLLGLF